MGRLIDADICLHKAWQNFYKQEEEHEKNIDGYDIMRDQFYEQSGFECCQQTIVNAPTVEAIPKDQYEARLKADMLAMLTELKTEIEEIEMGNNVPFGFESVNKFYEGISASSRVIQDKIDKLKGDK